MFEDSPGDGFRPPPWVKDDFTFWRIGWAREAQRGMAEALAEGKKKRRPDLDADIEGGRRDSENERGDE
jgi:hypothetical protein